MKKITAILLALLLLFSLGACKVSTGLPSGEETTESTVSVNPADDRRTGAAHHRKDLYRR